MAEYWKAEEAAYIARAQSAALGPRKRKKNLPKGASDSEEEQHKAPAPKPKKSKPKTSKTTSKSASKSTSKSKSAPKTLTSSQKRVMKLRSRMKAQVLLLSKRIYLVNTLAVIPVLKKHGNPLLRAMLRTWLSIVEMDCSACMRQANLGGPSIVIERKNR